MAKTIESKVAGTILEKKQKLEIGGEIYEVAPPTTATLILVSELVSQLPEVKKAATSEEILKEAIRVAKDCKNIADIPAVIILGAKNLTASKECRKPGLLGWLGMKEKSRIDKKEELATLLLQNYSPRELYELTLTLLMTLEIGDFFGFTTSLSEINLARPTKGEVETIASGQ